MSTFTSLGVTPEVLSAITATGLATPTLIQKQTVPEILKGSNVIAQGKPASGKTEAYGIGLLQRLAATNSTDSPQALVLVPTHELAIQVSDTLSRLGAPLGLHCNTCIGGTPLKSDLKNLHCGPAVIVGTFGRLLHLLELENGLSMTGVKIVVMDEADMIVSKDCKVELARLEEHIPQDCQLLLFATTMSTKSWQQARKFVKTHSSRATFTVAMSRKELMVGSVKQFYTTTSNKKSKIAAMCSIYPMIGNRKALIFCNLRKNAEELVRALKAKGVTVSHIHAEMPEVKRQNVIKSFRNSPCSSLITTDLLSWGFNLPSVSVVINCNTPTEDEYLHRVARCGRCGGVGVAISLVKKHEVKFVRRLERQFGIDIEEMQAGLVNNF